jgi:hypothetical protein
LKVILARDGVRFAVRAADEDGNAVPGAAIAIVPVTATSEAAMASAMITGETDASGAWTSPSVAPGKYYVIASKMPINRSVDSISRLWTARAGAETVEAAPGETVQLNRVPVPVK